MITLTSHIPGSQRSRWSVTARKKPFRTARSLLKTRTPPAHLFRSRFHLQCQTADRGDPGVARRPAPIRWRRNFLPSDPRQTLILPWGIRKIPSDPTLAGPLGRRERQAFTPRRLRRQPLFFASVRREHRPTRPTAQRAPEHRPNAPKANAKPKRPPNQPAPHQGRSVREAGF